MSSHLDPIGDQNDVQLLLIYGVYLAHLVLYPHNGIAYVPTYGTAYYGVQPGKEERLGVSRLGWLDTDPSFHTPGWSARALQVDLGKALGLLLALGLCRVIHISMLVCRPLPAAY